MRKIHPEPTVLIHPETAEKYGITDGDWVKIENNYGSCKQKAKLSIRIRKDTVSADHAWWFPERDPNDGTLFGVMECNINKLIPMRNLPDYQRPLGKGIQPDSAARTKAACLSPGDSHRCRSDLWE